MNTQITPINEINQQATQILMREMGVVNTVRFLNQFRTGQGDYTLERENLFANTTLDELLAEMKISENLVT